MQIVTLTLNGPMMLTHNERLANKMDPIVRQMSTITSKRTKTDDDLIELAKLEFLGGLYLTVDNKAGIPIWNIFKSLQNGAKLNRLGKHVERAVLPNGPDILPILHDGPNDPESMWLAGCYDQRSVKVQTSKVMRTRPRFLNWIVEASFIIDTELLNMEDFIMIANNAGQTAGIGDYRPRYGRFEVQVNS